ncbi:hypothetical protein O159_01000 [Leifsonia xyli subsp. cynodontis DSM 46306]|jgi:hypothetical protein|uniref:Uncharacterized protein n=1 Tax=Leifsonia xyli subsp. cynodontis DSM 46306 TaxID=1389489 RepID=U3P257_LEIXC|nr:hypothetical protein O159_01000 [Leifsonia xyli subsp. cynodontis DSM 46306]
MKIIATHTTKIAGGIAKAPAIARAAFTRPPRVSTTAAGLRKMARASAAISTAMIIHVVVLRGERSGVNRSGRVANQAERLLDRVLNGMKLIFQFYPGIKTSCERPCSILYNTY